MWTKKLWKSTTNRHQKAHTLLEEEKEKEEETTVVQRERLWSDSDPKQKRRGEEKIHTKTLTGQKSNQLNLRTTTNKGNEQRSR